MLEINDPGSLATVQDMGRPGAAALGVPRAGACDPLALAAANLLLGDEPGLPAIELTGGSPELVAHEDTILAVTGADIGLRMGVDGAWIRPGTSVLLRAGTVVRATTAPRAGLRTYLALPGGIDVPSVLGSGSTSLVGGFGGVDGRPLVAGDILRPVRVGARTGAGHSWPGPGPSSGVAGTSGPILIGVCPGPHEDLAPGVSAALLAVDWTVGESSDRVGLRLEQGPDDPEPGIRHDRSLDSFGLLWGAVELPPDGRPIVLLPDGPTVGGYPVPWVVATSDRARLGQLRPGDRIRFRSLDPAESRAAWLAGEAALEEARRRSAVMRSVW